MPFVRTEDGYVREWPDSDDETHYQVMNPIVPIYVSQKLFDFNPDHLGIGVYASLPEMTKYFGLEDIFEHIYNQNKQINFLEAKRYVTSDVTVSLLTFKENQLWLEENKDRYAAYVQRREEEALINKEPPVVYNVFESLRVFSTPFEGKGRYEKDGCFGIFLIEKDKSIQEIDDPIVSKEEAEYIFKYRMIEILYDYMGFEHLRCSDQMRLLLTPRA